MRSGGLRLPFNLLGIPVQLDYSFLLVLPLFAYLIGSQLPAYAELIRSLGVAVDSSGINSGATPWLLGLLGALGLFASVVVHELGHAVVARLYGVEVKEIRLWFLGGVAQFDEMPKARGGEAVVAVVGPITSVIIGLVLWQTLPLLTGNNSATLVVSYLAITNIVLAVFNLLPALPLDGGRVLRGVLAMFMPHLRATSVAASVSAAMAILLGLYGFFSFNFFLIIMAFFIYNAGRAEAQAAVMKDMFDGKTVADLMTREPITVEPDMTLEQFLQLIHYRPHTGYPVVDSSDSLLGFARLADARKGEELAGQEPTPIDPTATVGSIMKPAETAEAHESAMTALQRVATGNLGRLLVVDNAGKLLGILSKTDLVRILKEASARS